MHKESSIFGPYEGVRIAEIQTSNEFKDEKLNGWAWVPGAHNPADWCTKPRTVQDLADSDFYYKGPPFLIPDEADWPIRFTFSTEKLEGELESRKVASCNLGNVHVSGNSVVVNILTRAVQRNSSWNRLG